MMVNTIETLFIARISKEIDLKKNENAVKSNFRIPVFLWFFFS